MISVLFFFLFSSSIGRVVFGDDQYASFSTIALPPTATGPAAIAFDLFGGGPYVGVADGRILKWLDPDDGFVDFAYTSPNRYNHFSPKLKNHELLIFHSKPKP